MAHEGLWEQLEKLDPHRTAKRAKCKYHKAPERYIIKFLNSEYVVNLGDRDISILEKEPRTRQAEFLEQLCLLAYLIHAKDLPLANKLVRAESFPGGQFFFRGLHSLPTDKLKATFGNQPENLYQAAKRFDVQRCDFGDASIRFNMLPCVPITIVIWAGDEQFDARASILFDQTAAEQLPLDALLVCVNLAVDALVKI
jgi:hypothetical protein